MQHQPFDFLCFSRRSIWRGVLDTLSAASILAAFFPLVFSRSIPCWILPRSWTRIFAFTGVYTSARSSYQPSCLFCLLSSAGLAWRFCLLLGDAAAAAAQGEDILCDRPILIVWLIHLIGSHFLFLSLFTHLLC